MADVAEPEAAGSNRRVLFVVLIVALIIVYLIGRSVHKKSVIAGLASENAAVRKQSTETLMEWQILTDTLSRRTVPVKRRMIRTLRDMGTEEAAVELVSLMRDRNPTVQNLAQFALQAMQPTSLEKLVGGLNNVDLNIKNRCAAALINIGTPILKPVTKEVMVKDEETGKEEKTITRVVPIIEATMDAGSRAGVIRVLTAVHDGAPRLLLKKLADEKADAGTRACAIEILGRIGAPEAARPIREALNPRVVRNEETGRDEQQPVAPDVRKAALVALGRLRHPEAYRLLEEALSDKASDSAMKAVAIRGFGELQDPRAVPFLQQYLFGYDESLRDAAVGAFSRIGSGAVPALALLLKSDRYEVRIGALRSLAGIQDSRVVTILASALRDPDENVRRTAADALGRAGDASAVAPLVGALSDPAWRVATQVRDSLAVVGAPAVPALTTVLGGDPAAVAAYYAQGALERIGTAAVPALVGVARAGKLPASQRAVAALGTIGDARAMPVLKDLASAGAPPLRSAAERALKQLEEGRRAS
ncbi:MAG: HEAT repeat domain-containing protein [Armatimonadetes bacterium]|nr:HEAT repeat domain-containing protein [Armatimonadota bacterium]